MKELKDCTSKSIELWASELDKQPKLESLSKDKGELFLLATMNEDNIETDLEAKQVIEDGNNMASLMFKRIKYMHTYTTTYAVLLFLESICPTPGIAVMYCNYLQYKMFERRKKKLDMPMLTSIFPNGFFSDHTLTEFWRKQKLSVERGPDNMLDYKELGSSMIF